MNTPFVSIIIPVYHDWKALAGALEALDRQTWPREQFEVIVVNNDPASASPVSYQGPNLHMACEHKAGSYAARNKGITISRGELLGFCDADCVPCPCWIEKAAGFLTAHPACSRLAGKIELIYSGRKKRSYAEMHESVFAFRQEDYARNGVSATANLFVRRQVFDAVGIFNDALLSGGDLEWGARATAAGYGIGYCPEAVIRHPARRTVRQLMEKARRVCSGYILINDADIKKNPKNAVYHGLSMLKPPIEAGKMIFARKDIHLQDRFVLYFLEYLLKLVQFREYVRCQTLKRL